MAANHREGRRSAKPEANNFDTGVLPAKGKLKGALSDGFETTSKPHIILLLSEPSWTIPLWNLMRASILQLIFLFGFLLAASRCAASPPATQPTKGPIHCWDETRQDPPLHLHFVSIDLRAPAISVRVFRGGDDPDGIGPWQTTLATPSPVAEREHLDVAINGNFFWAKDTLALLGRKTPYFPGNWACAVGWAMSDGTLWSAQPASASLIIDASGRIHIGRYERIPEKARQIVSGSQLLVAGGRNIASGIDVAPRTAAGIKGDGSALVLLVVDGRRPAYSDGLTFPQLAEEMIRVGCSDALNLDGGGSSTLVLRDQTTGKLRLGNRPSDGHDLLFPLSIERPVADVLGIRCTTQPSAKP